MAQPGEVACDMALAVYDTSSGHRVAFVHEHEDHVSMSGSSNFDVAHYCILARSPSAEGLLFCMRGAYHILKLSTGSHTHTRVQPEQSAEYKPRPGSPIWVHNPMLPAYGWMSSSIMLVEGQLASPATSSCRDTDVKNFLISLDGIVMGSWRLSPGWQRATFCEQRQAFNGPAVPKCLKRSSAADSVCTW